MRQKLEAAVHSHGVSKIFVEPQKLVSVLCCDLLTEGMLYQFCYWLSHATDSQIWAQMWAPKSVKGKTKTAPISLRKAAGIISWRLRNRIILKYATLTRRHFWKCLDVSWSHDAGRVGGKSLLLGFLYDANNTAAWTQPVCRP